MTILKGIGIGILVIIGIYAIWAAFIPMLIGEKIVEREVIQQSPQYVISQNSALNKMYTEYTKAEGEVKEAIKYQMCDIASTIPSSEISNAKIRNICN